LALVLARRRIWAKTVQLANRKAARILAIRQKDPQQFGQVAVAKVAQFQARIEASVSATDVLQVLDELGGPIRTMEAFTRENREANYKAANLHITYHPVEQEVDLAVSLAPGDGANGGVGGATPANSDRRIRPRKGA
jgi:hypothetical protein